MGRVAVGLILIALATQVLVLACYGHAAYLWVQGGEAAAAVLPLLGYGIAYIRRDPRPSRWPPLFPLAAIAGTGAVKDFCVAAGTETPLAVAVLLLGSVGWFLASSWRIWQGESREKSRLIRRTKEGSDQPDP
jgi:hypothetical protein